MVRAAVFRSPPATWTCGAPPALPVSLSPDLPLNGTRHFGAFPDNGKDSGNSLDADVVRMKTHTLHFPSGERDKTIPKLDQDVVPGLALWRFCHPRGKLT